MSTNTQPSYQVTHPEQAPTTRRRAPAPVWISSVLLLFMAFISVVGGGWLFGISTGTPTGYTSGTVFLIVGTAYLLAAVRLPRGDRRLYLTALFLITAQLGFGAAKLLYGETESLPISAACITLLVLLDLPQTRRFFGAAHAEQA
jgi:hypothetical protein